MLTELRQPVMVLSGAHSCPVHAAVMSAEQATLLAVGWHPSKVTGTAPPPSKPMPVHKREHRDTRGPGVARLELVQGPFCGFLLAKGSHKPFWIEYTLNEDKDWIHVYLVALCPQEMSFRDQLCQWLPHDRQVQAGSHLE